MMGRKPMNCFSAAIALGLLVAHVVATPVMAKPAPIDVTRFHTDQTLPRLKGVAVMVEAAPGADAASLENQVWLDAVRKELMADRKSTRLKSSHIQKSRMPSSA